MSEKISAGDQSACAFHEMGGHGMARDLASAERHIRSFVKCGIALPISGSRDSEINIDGLPDYRMNESADVEEIKFFSDSGEES